MSIATDIQSAAAEVGASAQAAADRVTAAIGGLRTELATARQTIEDLIAAGNADAASLTEALGNLQAADAIVDSIEAAPAPEPLPET